MNSLNFASVLTSDLGTVQNIITANNGVLESSTPLEGDITQIAVRFTSDEDLEAFHEAIEGLLVA